MALDREPAAGASGDASAGSGRSPGGPPHAVARRRPAAGLCDSCRHQRLVGNTRGSEFSLCQRSRSEPDRYPRYPRVPVLSCAGHEPARAEPVTDADRFAR